ncbi:competence/damage-inducible protein A [bacterium]
MITELISIGSELLQGAVQDTNATHISRALFEKGIDVRYRTTVGDNKERMIGVLKTAVGRAELVLVTGGLGPTVDDMTIEAAAEAFGLTLTKNEAIENRIRELYKMIGIPFSDAALRQAMVPEEAELVENRMGTAPGVRFEIDGTTVILMPGVPREMKGMLEDAIRPAVEKAAGTVFVSRSLRVFGVGESNLEKILPKEIPAAENPAFSFLPHKFEVEIRLTAKGGTQEECTRILSKQCAKIYELAGEHIFGENGDTLELVAFRRLKETGTTIAFAESLTGGMVGSHLARVPGSSEVFLGSVVTYSVEAKEKLLGVPAEILDKHGPVSEETAVSMARGAIEKFGSGAAVATTGNAGPSSGDGKSEVGRVFIALAFADAAREPVVTTRLLKRPRNDVRLIAAMAALDTIRRNI